MRPLVLLRPQPGNDATAARARALGLTVVQAPLFAVEGLPAPAVPDGPFDALLLTSANGARHGAALLACFADLPLYAVGETTAQAARALGHAQVTTGGGDARSTVPLIVAAGHRYVLHVGAAETRDFDPQGLRITRQIVYRSVERPDEAMHPLLAPLADAVLAIHSPRAGRRIAALVEPARRTHLHIVAISPAALAACGAGWASLVAAAHPDDTALLRSAEALCNCGG